MPHRKCNAKKFVYFPISSNKTKIQYTISVGLVCAGGNRTFGFFILYLLNLLIEELINEIYPNTYSLIRVFVCSTACFIISPNHSRTASAGVNSFKSLGACFGPGLGREPE